MEAALFSPCTDLQDLLLDILLADRPLYDRILDPIMRACCPDLFPYTFQEVTMQDSTGNGTFEIDFAILRTHFTFNNFFDLASRKIVWVGSELFFKAKGAVVDIAAELNFGPPIFTIELPNNVNAGGENVLEAYTYTRSRTIATTTLCSHIFQLMTTHHPTWTHLQFNWFPSVSIPILSQFLSNPNDITGGNIYLPDNDLTAFPENYLRMFRNRARPIHQLLLSIGTQEPAWPPSQRVGIPSQFENVNDFFQHCQCTLVLYCGAFTVPAPLIRDALLRENCTIVHLILDRVPYFNDELLLALGDNNSLLSLTITDVLISDTHWGTLCLSLSVHPKLEYLRLLRTFPHDPPETSDQRKVTRSDLFVVMLDANTVLQELDARGGTDRTQDEFVEITLSEVIQPLLRGRRAIRAIPIE
jgi:hypothetical protein